MKRCPKCEQEKPRSEFYKDKKVSGGLTPYCKPCWNAYYTRIQKRFRDTDEFRQRSRKYSKEWAKKNPGKRAAYTKKWESQNRTKVLAHHAVKEAIRRGELQRKPCEVCASDKSDAHHDDYAKQLSVRWLCRKHHKEEHAN